MMKNLPKVVLALGLYLLPTTFLILALTFTERLEAANFLCPSGNVTCLIAAINEANGNGQENIIDVEPGVYTLTGTNNVADGPNGLPSITSTLTIRNDQLGVTIERDRNSGSDFRLFHVESQANLTLYGLGLTRIAQ